MQLHIKNLWGTVLRIEGVLRLVRKWLNAGVIEDGSWSETPEGAEEVLLVHGVQHLDHGPLEDLVLQGGDTERALAPVGLQDVGRLECIMRAAPRPESIGKACAKRAGSCA